ncbi:hypothetical protein TRIUR3_09224 [Triticum urartu]|uniref:Pathogen-related protein n=1 Tax=Triticum urartu TaxID=4572 RepID=M7YH73_TRIUA|nr:hypothetical protein TRIUR3_09224 [Triticum urartu]
MAAPAGDSSGGDKYRSHLAGEGEKNTVWRHGAPPTYDAVNSLFEAGRTQEWAKGSLEETVQNAIKTWEMELSHKARIGDFKSVRPGRYNALLASPILPATGAYDAAAETFESSHDLFRSAFPRGFAWEVVKVYSGPPVIAFKFRHWGHMEGPYKGNAPTGDKVEFYGVAVLKVDEQLRAEDVEIRIDRDRLAVGGVDHDSMASTTRFCGGGGARLHGRASVGMSEGVRRYGRKSCTTRGRWRWRMWVSFSSEASPEHHVWRHFLEALCGAPSVLAAVQGEAPDAMYEIIDESKAKLFLGSTKSRHFPPTSRVDGALAREVAVGAAAVFGGDRRCSRCGGDA